MPPVPEAHVAHRRSPGAGSQIESTTRYLPCWHASMRPPARQPVVATRQACRADCAARGRLQPLTHPKRYPYRYRSDAKSRECHRPPPRSVSATNARQRFRRQVASCKDSRRIRAPSRNGHSGVAGGEWYRERSCRTREERRGGGIVTEPAPPGRGAPVTSLRLERLNVRRPCHRARSRNPCAGCSHWHTSTGWFRSAAPHLRGGCAFQRPGP